MVAILIVLGSVLVPSFSYKKEGMYLMQIKSNSIQFGKKLKDALHVSVGAAIKKPEAVEQFRAMLNKSPQASQEIPDDLFLSLDTSVPEGFGYGGETLTSSIDRFSPVVEKANLEQMKEGVRSEEDLQAFFNKTLEGFLKAVNIIDPKPKTNRLPLPPLGSPKPTLSLPPLGTAPTQDHIDY